MKTRAIIAGFALCIACAAVALAVPAPDLSPPNAEEIVTVPSRGELDPPPGDPAVVLLLSGIDFIPSRSALDAAMGASAEVDLVAIARDGAPTGDPGVRVRAYRALSLYNTASAEDELRLAVAEHGDGADALDNLYLRAAMDSLASVAGASAVGDVSPHLTHASRDVRAAAARALATCGSPVAVPILRARLNVEPEEQVKAAISKAIRDLDGA